VSGAFVATCLWFVVANVIAMLPSRDHHWTAAYWLVACGVPILGWLTWEHGPSRGVVALAAGRASVLRWPVSICALAADGAWWPAAQGSPRSDCAVRGRALGRRSDRRGGFMALDTPWPALRGTITESRPLPT
jgi:hypothetical protein